MSLASHPDTLNLAGLEYRVCTRCVMDTSDPEISFDESGVCNHCRYFDRVTLHEWHPDENDPNRLNQEVSRIKELGRGQEYDCILGLSGGVDSSYMAIKIAELGLRPLVVHVDGGWNSEIAVSNIERVVTHCGFELYTHVMDWEDMRDLQLAYLRAGVSNQDVPQDHAFFANLYHFAIENNIRTVLSGGNIATEAIFPASWHGSAMDAINLKAIHKKWGDGKLGFYRTISFWQYYLVYPFFRKMRVFRPLNLMPYNRDEAISELEEKCGYRPYGRKHGESLFTRFFQNYYLPEKFGFDKRRPHLSSLIVSGQMTREEAMAELEEPLYTNEELELDKEFFCKKLGISTDELAFYMSQPNKHYTDYANWDAYYSGMKRVQAGLERLLGRRVTAYS